MPRAVRLLGVVRRFVAGGVPPPAAAAVATAGLVSLVVAPAPAVAVVVHQGRGLVGLGHLLAGGRADLGLELREQIATVLLDVALPLGLGRGRLGLDLLVDEQPAPDGHGVDLEPDLVHDLPEQIVLERGVGDAGTPLILEVGRVRHDDGDVGEPAVLLVPPLHDPVDQADPLDRPLGLLPGLQLVPEALPELLQGGQEPLHLLRVALEVPPADAEQVAEQHLEALHVGLDVVGLGEAEERLHALQHLAPGEPGRLDVARLDPPAPLADALDLLTLLGHLGQDPLQPDRLDRARLEVVGLDLAARDDLGVRLGQDDRPGLPPTGLVGDRHPDRHDPGFLDRHLRVGDVVAALLVDVVTELLEVDVRGVDLVHRKNLLFLRIENDGTTTLLATAGLLLRLLPLGDDRLAGLGHDLLLGGLEGHLEGQLGIRLIADPDLQLALLTVDLDQLLGALLDRRVADPLELFVEHALHLLRLGLGGGLLRVAPLLLLLLGLLGLLVLVVLLLPTHGSPPMQRELN